MRTSGDPRKNTPDRRTPSQGTTGLPTRGAPQSQTASREKCFEHSSYLTCNIDEPAMRGGSLESVGMQVDVHDACAGAPFLIL